MTRLLLAVLLQVILIGTVFAANSSREFGGVGIDGVARADGSIVVRQLVAGGPAHLAGIQAGDIITRIDGKATVGSDFKDMVEHRLRGRAGTRVTLQVRRPGKEKPLSFELVRRQLALGTAATKQKPKGD